MSSLDYEKHCQARSATKNKNFSGHLAGTRQLSRMLSTFYCSVFEVFSENSRTRFHCLFIILGEQLMRKGSLPALCCDVSVRKYCQENHFGTVTCLSRGWSLICICWPPQHSNQTSFPVSAAAWFLYSFSSPQETPVTQNFQ